MRIHGMAPGLNYGQLDILNKLGTSDCGQASSATRE